MARQTDILYINAYVSGTTAYKMEPVQPKKSRVRLPKAAKQQQTVLSLDPVAAFGPLVAVILMICLLIGVSQLYAVKQESIAMENYVAALQQTREELQRTYSESYDLEEIRQIATAMGMVPVSQVTTVKIDVTLPQPAPLPSAWDSFWAFVTEMFA